MKKLGGGFFTVAVLIASCTHAPIGEPTRVHSTDPVSAATLTADSTVRVILSAEKAPPSQSQTLTYVRGSTQKICQVTGEFDRERQQPTMNKTDSRYGVSGTDLGSSFEHDGKVYFLFGDTNGRKKFEGGDSIAYSSDAKIDDCLKLSFVTGPDGDFLSPQVPGVSHGIFEVPVGGFSTSGKMYVFFWTDRGKPDPIGRAILARSDDHAKSFVYLYQVSRSKFIDIAPVVVNNADIAGLPQTQGQGILLFGSGTYRQSNPYLAYLPVNQVEEKNALRFFAGSDQSGNPTWSEKELDAVPLFDQPCIGELSAGWNAYQRQWHMLFNCTRPRGVNLRVAEAPWGPWAEPVVLFHPFDDNGYCRFIHVSWLGHGCDSVHDEGRQNVLGGHYAPYLISRFTTGAMNTTTIYFLMSTWNPYNVVLMKSTLRLEGGH